MIEILSVIGGLLAIWITISLLKKFSKPLPDLIEELDLYNSEESENEIKLVKIE